MPGDRVGRWRVEHTLGIGAMGIVYACRDPETSRRAAIKVLHPRPYDGEDTDSAGWLRHEARALARLSHPGIVGVQGVGEIDGLPFMAMELIEGTTLGGWLQTRKRAPHQIARIFRDVADAVAAAHDASLVHGDLKPDNIMVDVTGRVRVMDFGLAEALGGSRPAPIDLEDSSDDLDAEATRRTASTPRGTPAYMAPERLSGAAGDPATDQFSLCVTFYEALYGQRPFSGRTPAQLYFRATRPVLCVAPPDKDVPAWLHAIVTRGLAVDPHHRWTDLRRLVRALDAGLRRRCVRRWSGFGAIAAIALVGLGSASTIAATPCAPAPARVESWSPMHAAAAERSMHAAGVEPGVAARARAVLESEVTATRTLRADACRRVRRSEDDADARIQLHRREAALASRLSDLDEDPAATARDLVPASRPRSQR
jgi:tRNA A-37 threonylcarbamoyl transferase component Bud32